MITLNLKFRSARLSFLVLLSLIVLPLSAFSQVWFELGVNANSLDANATIFTIKADNSGNVFAAGEFTDGADVNHGYRFVAKWNGVTWVELGAGLFLSAPLHWINTILPGTGGNIYTAGTFVNANMLPYVAHWNGSAWSELGSSSNPFTANSTIHSLAMDLSGNIYASGEFKDANNKHYVAKWDGSTWSELGTGANALNSTLYTYSVTTDATGKVYTVYSDGTTWNVMKWNGTSWIQVGTGSAGLNANDLINNICTDAAGNLYASGAYTDGNGKSYVAKWDGTSWTELGTGSNALNPANGISVMTVDPATGFVYVGLTYAIGPCKSYIAKWNGTNWSELGSGADSLNANCDISAITTDAAGNVYAGGNFLDNNSFHYVAKYGIPTGLESINKPNGNLNIFPNPATAMLTINLKDDFTNAQVHINDLVGKEVYASSFSGNALSLNVSDWGNGMYICTVYKSDATTTSRFIVNH